MENEIQKLQELLDYNEKVINALKERLRDLTGLKEIKDIDKSDKPDENENSIQIGNRKFSYTYTII